VARAPTRAIVISGREGKRQTGVLRDLENRTEERRRRIKTVSILLLLSPLRMSAERKQTPQVVENPSNSRRGKRGFR
jgi:hypothetical protein